MRRSTGRSLARTTAAATTAITPSTRSALAFFAHIDALHHLAASRFARCGHLFAARCFACAAPEHLAAHGHGHGFFASHGCKFSHVFARNALLGEFFNVLHEAFFIQTHQADRIAIFASAAGAANAVHVILAHIGHFVVHHVWQLFNINPACGNIGGHQGAQLAAFEFSQRLRAGALALVAMQSHRADALLF